MKLDSEFHARHDEGRRGQHDFALGQPVAVDFGFGKVRDQVVGRIGSPRRDLRCQEIAQILEGGDVLRRSPFCSLVGRDREDDLAPDLGVIAVRQAHGAEQQADGDLAGKIVDELERSLLGHAVERAIGDLQRRLDHAVEIPAEKGCLAKGSQPIVTWRVGCSQRCAGAAGQFVDHIAG